MNVRNQQHLLASVTRQLSETSQTFARLPEVQRALSDWYAHEEDGVSVHRYHPNDDAVRVYYFRWEEPAQSVVPWVQFDGMNLDRWREQWAVAVAKYRRLQGNRHGE